MLVDPFGNRLVAGASPKLDQGRVSFLVEVSDQFTGVPRGTAKPLTLLAALQEAEPYLGLPSHAFKLISWLVKQTMAIDWEEGSRPIVWPSARRQQEFLNLSAARVKVLNRALYEAGIFVIRDNPQGMRIPIQSGHRFRFESGHRSDLMPATIPK